MKSPLICGLFCESMKKRMLIIEVSLRHATPQGTLRAAMELPAQWAGQGINTVFVLPWMEINRERSASPYAITDHMRPDEGLGMLDDAVRWIERCHACGLEVVLDMPLNHTSPDHCWREHDGWYSMDEKGNFHAPRGTDWNDVLQLNHSHPGVIAACEDVLKFWLNIGIDGFRMDAAAFIPPSVLMQWKSSIERVKGRTLHLWCDGADYARQNSFFTSYLYHEAFQTAHHDMEAWKTLLNTSHEGAIFYLSNHDTLHAGKSPAAQWPERYQKMRALLEASSQHVMLSWNDYSDIHGAYSFLT